MLFGLKRNISDLSEDTLNVLMYTSNDNLNSSPNVGKMVNGLLDESEQLPMLKKGAKVSWIK